MNKVYGGTPKMQQSLCVTCRAAWLMKTINLGQVVVCRALGSGLRISAPVVECATYDNKSQPSLFDMQQIAWEVRSRSRGEAGFAGNRDMQIEVVPPDPNRYPSQPSSPTADAAVTREREAEAVENVQ